METMLTEHLDESCGAQAEEIHAKWTAESEERIDAVDEGALPIIDGRSALRDLRSFLNNVRTLAQRSSISAGT